MRINDFIVRDPEILGGKPIIKGTRISVELIIRKLSENYSFEELLHSYPHLTKDQILACLAYTAERITQEDATEAA